MTTLSAPALAVFVLKTVGYRISRARKLSQIGAKGEV
jgi:hypothetical protein